MVRRFHFPLLLFIGFIHISAVLAEEAGSPPHTRIQDDKFCYYWMEIGLYTNAFNLAGWNGNENEKASAYIKGNIKETCSHLTSTGPTTNTSGITYLLSSSSEQRGHLTDVLFYCCKVCTQMGNYELLPFMRNLYLQHYQMLARLGKRPNKALAAHDTKRNQHCRNGLGFRLHNWESHACISWVELHGTHVRYYAGPMLINNMQQWEMKLDNKASGALSYWAEDKVIMRNCFRYGAHPFRTPQLRRFALLSSNEWNLFAILLLHSNSTRMLFADEHSCIGKRNVMRDWQAIMHYRSVEMDTAEGCTYGEENGGSRHCVKRRTSCPSYDNDIDAEEEVVVHCCCNGSHLCNHDTLSYHAISMIPIEAKA
ncbi:unnamed protein product [Toxocara canis]|uniref:SCP domain-containing protein n=1 Tax=Toxocara canis TaxID=6265 RepID=A0A183UI95_TOXCA|nr:unnamed protein product [Toxocara canis]